MKDMFAKISLFLVNATIFFSDFLPYNTLIKCVAIICLIVNLFVKKKSVIYINHIFYMYILFSIYIFINILFGGDIQFIVTFMLNTIMMILIASTPDVTTLELKMIGVCSSFHFFASLFVMIAPVGIVNSIFQVLLRNNYFTNYDWRIIQKYNCGVTTQPGLNSFYLLCFFGCCLVSYISGEKRYRILKILGCLLSMVLIITTGKRSTILFVVLATIMLWCCIREKVITKKGLSRIFFIIVTSVVSLTCLFKYTDIFNSLIDKMALLLADGDVSNGRLELWSIAFDEFLENPVFGCGLKTIYEELGVDVHCTYLQVLAEVGFFGFLIFTIGIIRLFISGIKKCKYIYQLKCEGLDCKPILFSTFILIYLMMYGFVGNTFIDYLPLSMFTISCALLNGEDFSFDKVKGYVK